MKATPLLMARRHEARTTTEFLPLDQLHVDHAYQRHTDENRVARLAAAFDIEKVGILHVSRRDDGTLWIIDGAHRRSILNRVGVLEWECKVYEGLTRQAEARIFSGLNTFAKPRPIDHFRADVVSGDPTANAIVAILQQAGWRLGSGDVNGVFSAVVAARKVYTGFGAKDKEVGPKAFADTVAVITNAWGHQTSGMKGDIVMGVGVLLIRHPDIDKAALSKKLACVAGGPNGLLGQARGLKQFSGGTVGSAISASIVTLYNKGRRTNILPDWRKS